MRDRQGPHTDYVTVAQACCNPFTDQPLKENKRHDYFMATSLTDERVQVTYRLLLADPRPLPRALAGAHWGLAYAPPPLTCPHITRRRESH